MTHRQRLILGSLILVVIALFAALIYVLLTAPIGTSEPLSPPPEIYSAPVAAVTARSAYAVAWEATQKWQKDAYLVSASTSWRNATVDMFREPVSWAFQFYSPSARQVQILSVSGGEAKALRESRTAYDLSPVTAEAWQMDSPQALGAWLNAGGGRFLRSHTLVDVRATLRFDKENGQVVWSIAALESGGEDFFSHLVEAGS